MLGRYGVGAHPDLVTFVTDTIVDDMKNWLFGVDPVYAIAYLGALVGKLRTKASSRTRV